MAKFTILEKYPDPDDKTAHLKPIIEFLIERGNIPYSSKFMWDRSGIGTFLFKNPVDFRAIIKEFDFPGSIRVGEDPYHGGGIVFDRAHALKIHQDW